MPVVLSGRSWMFLFTFFTSFKISVYCGHVMKGTVLTYFTFLNLNDGKVDIYLESWLVWLKETFQSIVSTVLISLLYINITIRPHVCVRDQDRWTMDRSRNLVLCPAQPGLLIVMKRVPQFLHRYFLTAAGFGRSTSLDGKTCLRLKLGCSSLVNW